MLFNMSRSGARYYIHSRNRFQYSAARGMVIQAPHGVIEDNLVTAVPVREFDSTLRTTRRSPMVRAPPTSSCVATRSVASTSTRWPK